jgi:hypothetical protein
VAEQGWQVWIDTGCASPDDIHNWDAMPKVNGGAYRVGPRSVVALVAQRGIWDDPDKVLLDPYGRAVAVPAGASQVLRLPLYRRGAMNLHEPGPADPESARSGRAASLPDGSGRRATARVHASTSLSRRFLAGN